MGRASLRLGECYLYLWITYFTNTVAFENFHNIPAKSRIIVNRPPCYFVHFEARTRTSDSGESKAELSQLPQPLQVGHALFPSSNTSFEMLVDPFCEECFSPLSPMFSGKDNSILFKVKIATPYLWWNWLVESKG